MLSRFFDFRLDCFACISKTEVSSTRNLGAPFGSERRPVLNNELSVLYWLARMDRVAPLLVVSEHGTPYSLASAEDSYHTSTGFASSNYILA